MNATGIINEIMCLKTEEIYLYLDGAVLTFSLSRISVCVKTTKLWFFIARYSNDK